MTDQEESSDPQHDKDVHENESDNESSSDSSNSDSSSDSSDSDSDISDGENEKTTSITHSPSKNITSPLSSTTTSSNLSISSQRSNTNGHSFSVPKNTISTSQLTASEQMKDVNSTRAAARFKQENATSGLMALGTKKRDRRTIEQIKRDIDLKKNKQPRIHTNDRNEIKKSGNKSPPKGSPLPSSNDSNSTTTPMDLMPVLSINKMPKQNANTARGRLVKILNGRGGSTVRSKPTPATMDSKKSSNSSGTKGLMKNHMNQAGESPENSQSEMPTSTLTLPHVETKAVRLVHKALVRYGDLTDVAMEDPKPKVFADELKYPQSFLHRANVMNAAKVMEEKLKVIAIEIATQCQKAITETPGIQSIRVMDVEVKPIHVIERLYENLKLRVAVQRALRDHGSITSNTSQLAITNAVYALIPQQYDISILGIQLKDVEPWKWGEKDHEWNRKKDTALLLGIYIHGFGSWEDILNDDLLHFHKQRAMKGERMKKRAETLLKKLPSVDQWENPNFINIMSINKSSNQSLSMQSSPGINSNPVNTKFARAAERAANRGSSLDSSMPSNGSMLRHNQNASVNSLSLQRIDNGNISSSERKIHEKKDRLKIPQNQRKLSSTSSHSSRSSSQERTKNKRKLSSTINNADNGVPSKVRKRSNDSEMNGDENGRIDKSTTSPNSIGSSVLLDDEQLQEKWQPNKRLRDIRQVLKKMRIMSTWAQNQKDEIVVEKLCKYVTIIGQHIDSLVIAEEEKQNGQMTEYERDEFCNCLWKYVAMFSPFSCVQFEQLYDDICLDAQVVASLPA